MNKGISVDENNIHDVKYRVYFYHSGNGKNILC